MKNIIPITLVLATAIFISSNAEINAKGIVQTKGSARPQAPKRRQARMTGQNGVVGTTGNSVILRVTLKDGFQYKPLEGRDIQFNVRWYGTNQYSSAGSATTDSKGTASVTVDVPKDTKNFFNYQAVFAGDTEPDDSNVINTGIRMIYQGKIVQSQSPSSGSSNSGEADSEEQPAKKSSGGSSKPTPQKPSKTSGSSGENSSENSGGETGGDESSSADNNTTSSPSGPVMPPVRDLLRAALKDQGGKATIDEDEKALGISENAVQFIPKGFSENPARFWIDVSLQDFQVQPPSSGLEKILGKTVPIMEASTRIQYRLVDVVTGVQYAKNYVEKKKKSVSFTVPVQLDPSLVHAGTLGIDPSTGKSRKASSEKEIKMISLNDLFKSSDTSVIKDAMSEAVKQSNKLIGTPEHLYKVIRVNKKKVGNNYSTSLILQGDDESKTKPGDKLNVYDVDPVKDNKDKVIRIDYTKKAVIIVKKISTSSHTIDCELVSVLAGSSIEKGDVCSLKDLAD